MLQKKRRLDSGSASAKVKIDKEIMVRIAKCLITVTIIFLLPNVLFAQEKEKTVESKLKNLFGKRLFLLTGEVGRAIPTEGSKGETVSIYSLNLGYNATPNISLVGSIERTSSFEVGSPEEDVFASAEADYQENLEENVKSMGKIKISGFLGSIRYRVIREGVFLWLYGGVGQYSYEYDISEIDSIWQSFSEISLNELVSEVNRETEVYVSLESKSIWTDSEIDKSIGYHVGANLDIPITDNIFLYGNGKYFFLKTKSKITFNLGGRVKASYLWAEETIPLDTIRFTIDEDLNLSSAVVTGGLKVVF